MTMPLTKADTAELLTYLAANFQGTNHRFEVNAAVVEIWHRQFEQNHVGQRHIVLAAIDRHMLHEDSNWGVNVGQIIRRYKAITNNIANRYDGWELLTYWQRQKVLADPAECDYAQGVITTSQYESTRVTLPAIAPIPITDDEFNAIGQEHGLPDLNTIGRMPA